jgi:hypothetical protein
MKSNKRISPVARKAKGLFGVCEKRAQTKEKELDPRTRWSNHGII